MGRHPLSPELKAESLSRQRAYRKQWKKDNPEKVATHWQNKRSRDPEYRRCSSMKHTYGITCDEYRAMLELQNGRCLICNRTAEESKSRHDKLAIDHNHTTGKVRGLLCTNCNKGLGQLQDSPTILLKAADYLIK